MRSRVLIVSSGARLSERPRAQARDGWRLFRSSRDRFEVAVPAYQLARVEAIARREKDEWHALAVGELFSDADGAHAVIRDFVPNEWAERDRVHVRVAATAEGQVRDLAEELHPTLRPLGIIHTHPGYSTEPSGTDRKEFWRDPHALSIILDPFERPTVAVYRGPEGERLEETANALATEPANTPPPTRTASVPNPSELTLATIAPPLRPKRRSRSRIGAAVLASALLGSGMVPSLVARHEGEQTRQSTELLRHRLDEIHSALTALEPPLAPHAEEGTHALECSLESGGP